jgi:hypothetical protein
MAGSHTRHQWIKQDSTGRSKTCDRCSLHVGRFGTGRTSYYAWSFPGGIKGDTLGGRPCRRVPDTRRLCLRSCRPFR